MNVRFIHVLGLMLATFLGSTQVHAGSLFDPQTFKSLTSDNKAFRVGDVLTVQVIENSSAVTSADTGTRRKNDINASVSGTGNTPNTIQGGVAVGGVFDGGGSTQRTNRLLATVSVTVQEILPNGEMRIAGEQLLTVNQEQQKVNLEGRVRPQDISDGNVVLSTRLAEARITYEGEGDVSERSKRGAWRRLLDWIGF
jgi:flagellar L-ring protein precursor FlgH